METFPRYWPFVRGIHRHKGQWRVALMFSLICAWISGWVNNCEAGDLRLRRAHYDVIEMYMLSSHLSKHIYHEPHSYGSQIDWSQTFFVGFLAPLSTSRGVEVTKTLLIFCDRYISTFAKCLLYLLNHSHIWHVLPHLSCGIRRWYDI